MALALIFFSYSLRHRVPPMALRGLFLASLQPGTPSSAAALQFAWMLRLSSDSRRVFTGFVRERPQI
jgi:hypothetical protein